MHKTICPLLALLCLLSMISPILAQELAGRVVGVTDGDTLHILTKDKTQYMIRLNGVDSPEISQPYGQAAKQFTSKAVYGKTVKFIVKDKDKYGRTVAVVIGPDGKNLNQSLVRNGYAWWYRQYAIDDNSLRQLEFEARKAQRGLWAKEKVANAIAPWEWRQGKRPIILQRVPVRIQMLPSGIKRGGHEVNDGRSGRGVGSGRRSAARSVVPVTRTVYITNTGAKYHEAH